MRDIKLINLDVGKKILKKITKINSYIYIYIYIERERERERERYIT